MPPHSWKPVADKADELERDGLVSEATAYLMAEREKGMRHPEVLWRTCRALYRSGQETDKPQLRATFMKDALAACQEAVEADPESLGAHTWTGIVLAKQDVSAKQRVANAVVIRDHFTKALEKSPHDAMALHAMGTWCYTVMSVSWAERKLAGVLFGEPPTCTPEECLKYALHSSREGDTIQNATLVGDVYANYRKDKTTAKLWYQRAMDMPVNTAAKRRSQQEAEKKFKSI